MKENYEWNTDIKEGFAFAMKENRHFAMNLLWRKTDILSNVLTRDPSSAQLLNDLKLEYFNDQNVDWKNQELLLMNLNTKPKYLF